MSDFQASDTFLSRVFGLHSVYNQINDNYQYYDDEEEQTNGAYDSPRKGGNPNLLDSESDLDSEFGDGDGEDSQFHNDSIDPFRTAGSVREFNQTKSMGQKDFGVKSVSFPKEISSGNRAFINEDAEAGPLYTAPNQRQQQQPPQQSQRKPASPPPNIGAVAFELPLYHKKPAPEQNNPSLQTIYQRKNRSFVIPPKERALYLWANITNMDEFLNDIYYYYRGNGYLNIAMTRIVDLFTLVFVLGFTIFLKYGIDYDLFLNRTNPLTLKDLIKPSFDIPLTVKFLLFGFTCYIILRLVQLYFDLSYKLKEIRNFYKHLINIPDDNELMTISWSTIVERLMLLKDYNGLTTTNDPHYLNDLSSKVRLDAHDIANRIMRKENYMIGLINKNVLDLSIKIPLINYQINPLTRTLEWNLQLCINNFVFNKHGQINGNILKEVNRNKLAAELRSRFQMSAIINLILCPFIVTYFVLLYFFKYFNEYKTNPGSIFGLRQYTPLAEWKLREFNELQHFFMKRLQLSIGPANTYINQFPRGFLTYNLMKLVNFVSGSFMAILVIYGLWFDDEEHSFWSFELTENKSSLFYISIFGTIWAVTNNATNSVPNEDSHTSFFYDPEASLRYVSQFTHYLPSSWNGKLHTVEVKNEFCELFNLKIVTILNELMSLVLTPFILWFNISNVSSLIIDFYRDYSIHVDGLGYVCYYAMFNFEEKDKNMMFDLNKRKRSSTKRTSKHRDGATNEVELDLLKKRKAKAKKSDGESSESEGDDDQDLKYDSYQDEKMIKSYMYFLESYDDKKRKVKPNQHQSQYQNQYTGNSDAGTSPKSNTHRKRKAKMVHEEPKLLLLHLQSLGPEMMESMYNINYKFDDSDEPQTQKSGVLGMLNQFYKHSDIGR